jgi:hypothetical protein
MITFYLYANDDTVNINMDFSAFSDGQVRSKIYLCEQLEGYLKPESKIVILGCWYNILGFILNIRRPNYYQSITGYDIDSSTKSIADQINKSWTWGSNPTLQNFTADANELDLNNFDVVINTSIEHFASSEWYNKLSNNQLICLQSSDVVNDDPVWDIKNPCPNTETFKSKYPMSQIYFDGWHRFDYGHLTYRRFMLIGKK